MFLLSAMFMFPVTLGQMVGQLVDEHNCVTDGGYQWCETTQECIRPWLTHCDSIIGSTQGTIDICSSQPCQNGGQCNSVNGIYNCLCPQSYTGVNCESQVVAVAPPSPPSPVQFCPNSQPQMCRMMCPTIQCSSGQCAMRHGNCCDLRCEDASTLPPPTPVIDPIPVIEPPVPTPPVPTPPVQVNTIPSNCIVWNDGCNTCSVVNGQLGACTQMMCFTQGLAHCTQYNNALQVGDICYRFCEDGSEPNVNNVNDCPVGTTCEAPASLGFDSCHQMAHRCIVGHR